MALDFEFYAGGIEDAIIQLLESQMKSLGVKDFATYSGELDSENLKKALGELTLRFPLIMVSYADGEDTELLKTSPVFGSPITFRHDCTFIVICASADARGTNAQRRGALVGNKKLGVYQMIARVRELLSGLQIKAMHEGKEVLLTLQPLMPKANEFIARLPNISAYAVPFETYFKWSSVDRSEAGDEVSEIILDVDSLNTPSGQTENVPGVKITLGEKRNV